MSLLWRERGGELRGAEGAWCFQHPSAQEKRNLAEPATLGRAPSGVTRATQRGWGTGYMQPHSSARSTPHAHQAPLELATVLNVVSASPEAWEPGPPSPPAPNYRQYFGCT